MIYLVHVNYWIRTWISINISKMYDSMTTAVHDNTFSIYSLGCDNKKYIIMLPKRKM